jgi:hypothetical protein
MQHVQATLLTSNDRNEMKLDLLRQIGDLKQRIETTDISSAAEAVDEWGGADVIIQKTLDPDIERWLGDQATVISLQSTEPRRRAVITKYSRELSWLFYELGGVFFEEIDYASKYDFYGRLAQSAIDYLASNEEIQDAKGLLLTVLNASKDFGGDSPFA